MAENSVFFRQVMQRFTAYAPLSGVNQEFIDILLHNFEGKPFSAADFDGFPIELIVEYIQRTHVFYLQTKLPEIEQSISLLSDLYTSHHPVLAALQQFFHRYCADLTTHIGSEESSLLPYVELLCRSFKASDQFSEYILARDQYTITRFLSEHHDTEDELRDIRDTIRLYDPPATNESLYRILLTQLESFEQDLCVHAHIEDKVLIPKALEMETRLNNRLAEQAVSN